VSYTQHNRSKFYDIEPAHIGSSQCERLTSYLCRLSEAHCVTRRNLIDYGIVPLLSKSPNEDYEKKRGIGFYKWTQIDGRGTIASGFVNAVEQVTLREDIRFTTLIGLQGVLPDKGLLRSNRAWCPLCLEDERYRCEPVTEALLWALNLVKLCPVHDVPLEEYCPQCKKSSSVCNQKRNGFCPYCNAWLGASTSRTMKFDDIDYYISQELGELISAMPNSRLMINRESLYRSIKAIAEKLTQGKVKTLARLLQVPPITLRGWYKGEHIPELAYTLEICRKCHLSINDFFAGNVHDITIENHCRYIKPRNQRCKINWCKIGRMIQTGVTSNRGSVKEVASILGVDRRALIRKFPEMSKISSK